MNIKLKKVFSNYKVILVLVCMLLAIVAIHPDPWSKGVAIRSIMKDSSASASGIERPKPITPPMSREIIIGVDTYPVNTVEDYHNAISGLGINRTLQIRTNKGTYKLVTKEEIEVVVLNETIDKNVTEVVEVDGKNKTITKVVSVPKTKQISHGVADIGFRVTDAPTTNIRKGLDLQGGTRVLLKPERKVSIDEMDMLISNINERLNVYGLSDVVVREAGDLSGNQYVTVEIAGANEEEIKELLANEGKFEAKVGNNTVFSGGKDITYVCRSAECAGIDPYEPCGTIEGGQWLCRFRFSMSLSTEAAQRQADATKDLEIVTENKNSYLSEKIYLYLDNELVDELNIGAELKGKPETQIQISGSGIGETQQEAIYTSLANMKRLQTILITGSLPIKLEITKTDTISTFLGEEFLKNAIMIGLLALVIVAGSIYLRYRRIQIVIPILTTMLAEALILLGVAALIGWNIDVSAIAGIIISIGSGVNDQIVITDEILGGTAAKTIISNWKERIKSAFFIVTAAYFTICVAMLPLLFAGAGLLKGFALTTIIGVSIGVFITRPAYASAIEILLK